ncbi:type III-A CRISPR-associated protein Cas10/Csm1 [Petralouisia muris]|uniref:Type III-A CRISPR-associated protein Cas10/Csm1 n=1 Tax=Petralouisia muris TaxID=3032872 RepID=A0AC61RZV0_9FIRM|nr:type III-A CRISPR-associated protein Cas10/Csm1 [Petralouisia muris]TGY97288.1 type III-A CRISPR-associated protein Cas10/Csm1 [Petralouisia muris]
MTKEKVQLIVGGLLHDIGKVIYRQGDGRKHSISGYEFLKEEVGLKEKEVLDSVRYHHGAELGAARIDNNSFAYITYLADNIAASADRRKNESGEKGFVREVALESVFNILNGNEKKMYYSQTQNPEETMSYPTEQAELYDEHFYLMIKQKLMDNFKGIRWEAEYVNSLLEILEGNLSLVPSSTAKDELADISLYDHLKLTAALSSCIFDYLHEKQIESYKTSLFLHGSDFQKENAFLLFSMDISGIQNFIYTIHSEGALKNLRARSFYLEIMMEHMIDTLLERLELSRANLIYAGGGHCYLLLANTEKTIETVLQFEQELNQWMLEQFDISLYVAAGWQACSGNALKDKPVGAYAEIFKSVSNEISRKKSARYDAKQIRKLNGKRNADYTRECKVCKRIDHLTGEGICQICASILNMSKDILYTDFFSITGTKEKQALPLPFDVCLAAENADSLRKRMTEDPGYVRAYGKNKMFSGKHIATKIWVGNYTTGETFEELANQAEGIERIGILRADVDNLGKAFVSGFESEKYGNRYVTLTRTAVLSRQLSLFFRHYINIILKQPRYSLDGKVKKNRKAAVVYSGGDDLFLAGAWDDILELAVDIRQEFKKFTEGTLSLSTGIGLYQPKFPIHVSAGETAKLEDESKMIPGKNAITFLPDGKIHEELDQETGKVYKVSDGTYSWEVFLDEVIEEKYRTIAAFFQKSEDRGKNFLYHLLELVRRQEDKINLARFVYLLARMEPGERAEKEEKAQYQEFSRKMYQWIKQEKDCRQLKTAINLYAYKIREKEETE